jgi:hypothetical protein
MRKRLRILRNSSKDMTDTLEVTKSTSKRAKFVEMANKRTDNALHAIALIGNLSNKSTYDYSEDDINQIIGALNKMTQEVREKFVATKGPLRPPFRLK